MQSAAVLRFDAEIWAYGKYMLLQTATNLLLQDATSTYIRKSKRPGRNDAHDDDLTRSNQTYLNKHLSECLLGCLSDGKVSTKVPV